MMSMTKKVENSGTTLKSPALALTTIYKSHSLLYIKVSY